jgi:segregation and condensation protein B
VQLDAQMRGAIRDTIMDELKQIKNILEAALLTSGEPLPLPQLARLFDPPLDADFVRRLLDEIRGEWSDRSVELAQVASGFRFQAKPEVQSHLDRLTPEKSPRYSRAVMETLAIMAYRQPVTRGDIEAIRGVTVSTNVLRTLEERQWVEVVGHRETPGRPALYATTKTFLDDLGLRSLAELPPLADLDPGNLLELTDAPTPSHETERGLADGVPEIEATPPPPAEEPESGGDSAAVHVADVADVADVGPGGPAFTLH